VDQVPSTDGDPGHEGAVMTFKLKNDDDYTPPNTWEAFRDLPYTQKVVAARYFMRQAAMRLHAFGFPHTDLVNLFNAMPEWITNQWHVYKQEQHELDKPWVCNECGHIAKKREFFKEDTRQMRMFADGAVQLAVCPVCGMTNAEKCNETNKFGFGPRELNEKQIARVEKKKEALCICDGHECPVCANEPALMQSGCVGTINDHKCLTCKTIFCEVCHRVKQAKFPAAYRVMGKCECGE
jgi:hypothetical protein